MTKLEKQAARIRQQWECCLHWQLEWERPTWRWFTGYNDC